MKRPIAGRSSFRHKHRVDAAFAVLTIAPTVLLVFICSFLPVAKSIYLSFLDFKLSRAYQSLWNNFQNYKEILAQGDLVAAVKVTLVFVAVVVFLQLCLGLLLALILNSRIHGRRLARSLVLLPWVIPTVITALLWNWLYQPQYGLINYVLLKTGLIASPASWLADVKLALPSVMVTALWKQLPLMALMLLAGLQSIPVEMYEAARMDGAGALQSLRFITLPFLRSVIRTTVMISIILNFKQFPLFWIMTGGGPIDATTTLAIYSYKSAFVNLDFGKGAAIATLWLVLLVAVYLGFNRLFKINEVE
ncbi:MAG: carbohydrate ABC transporter permease [Bacteroidota bacterium]